MKRFRIYLHDYICTLHYWFETNKLLNKPIRSFFLSNKLFLSISIYFYLFQIISVYAQSDSLHYYLELAVENNPVVRQKFFEYQAALQKVPQVGSLPDPELSMGVFISPMEIINGKQVADLRLMQMFPWFGTLRNAKDEMSLMANAKYESFREAQLAIIYDVQRTWYDLYRIRQNILISEKNIDLLRTIERLALIKFRAAPLGSVNSSSGSTLISSGLQISSGTGEGMQGMGGNAASSAQPASNTMPPAMQGSSMTSPGSASSLTDLYRVQMEIGELENNIALLKNQQSTLIARFNSILNRSEIFPVSLPDTLFAEPLEIPVPAVSDSLLANNPMLGMLQYEQQSLSARKRMVKQMGNPMIGLGLNYTVVSKNEMSTAEMNGNDMIMPMVAVTLPIYRKKYRAMQTEADRLKAAAAQSYIATVSNLRNEYYQAVQFYQDAQRRITLYTNQRMLSGKSFEIMIKSFAASGSELQDILRMRQQSFDYDYKKVEAIADFNTAIAWLKRLMASEQEQ